MNRRDFLKLTSAAVAGCTLAGASPWSFAQGSGWPVWMRRGDDEYRVDASTPEGYQAVRWLLRDVSAGKVGLPHLDLIRMISYSQAWVAAYNIHSLYTATSGLRLPETNDKTEGASKNSLHMPDKNGWFFALDFRAKGLTAEYTAKLMEAVGMGGVGLYWRRNFVHGDVGRKRSWARK